MPEVRATCDAAMSALWPAAMPVHRRHALQALPKSHRLEEEPLTHCARMDPNTALENILRGYLIGDHALALSEWLAGQGFAPDERTIPNDDDCAIFAAGHCARHYSHLDRSTIRVRADKIGLWTAPPEGPWISLAIWADLIRFMLTDEDDARARARAFGRAEGERVAKEFLDDNPEIVNELLDYGPELKH